jgi:hypothetical protein
LSSCAHRLLLLIDQSDKFQVTILNNKKSNSFLFTFKKSQEIFLREILQLNSQIPHSSAPLSSPPSPSYEDSPSHAHQSIDEPQLGTMQINIKDIRHVIEIFSTDDAHQVAEEFVTEHKLKANSLARIESELLRTQLDTCHLYQAKLRQYISYLRRAAVCSSDLDSRVLSLEYHLHDILLAIHHFKQTISSRLQEMMKKHEKQRQRWEKKNETLLEMTSQMLGKLKEKQQTEKILTFHCYELEGKLNRAIEVISAMAAAVPAAGAAGRNDRGGGVIRNLDQDFETTAEEDRDRAHPPAVVLAPGTAMSAPAARPLVASVGTMTDLSPSPAQPIPVLPSPEPSSPSPSNHFHSSAVEKLATETSDILATTLETLRAEYERRIQQYDTQHRADQQRITELEADKEQWLQQHTQQQQEKQEGKPEDPQQLQLLSLRLLVKEKSTEVNKLEEQVHVLREQHKLSVTTANHLRLSLQQLQSKNELLSLQTQNISKRSQEQEEENHNLRTQLGELLKTTQGSGGVQRMEAEEHENRVLNEQVVTLRGEVLRLQAEIQDIQEKALQAVQVVQLLDKDKDPTHSSSSHHLSQSQRSLVHGSLSKRSLSSSAAKNLPSSHSLPNSHDDGEVTVELSLEPEEDDEDEAEGKSPGGKDAMSPTSIPKETHLEAEVDAEAEVDLDLDLMLQQSLVNLKLEEKSIASLSPVVEDRLLRNIYRKYALETTGLLTLSRFGRFTKEFKIAGTSNGQASHSHVASSASQEPLLVYGDIDLVYVTTLKRVPPELPAGAVGDKHQSPAPLTTKRVAPSPSHSHASPFIPPGKVHFSSADTGYGSPSGAASASAVSSSASGAGSHMTVHQFLSAVQELAVRLYSKVIEQKTGTVLECLPAQQRERAMRAAMDVFMLKKIVPIATQLSGGHGAVSGGGAGTGAEQLIPWELMVLDQCLTTIHSSELVEAALVNHIHIFLSWYAHYARGIQLTATHSNAQPNGMGSIEEKGRGSREMMRSPAGFTSSPLPYGASASPSANPSPHRISHLQSSHGSGTGYSGSYSSPNPLKHTGYHSLSTLASSPSPRLPHPSSSPASASVSGHLFKGISYKEISKFYHDYGIVPYLLKEPQLFKSAHLPSPFPVPPSPSPLS